MIKILLTHAVIYNSLKMFIDVIDDYFSDVCIMLLVFLTPVFFVQVCNATHDRKHADHILEEYVTITVMNVITTFFNSPFSDQSTTVQVLYIALIGNIVRF